MIHRSLNVAVRDGLHARPATQFVALARRFAASIEIERAGKRADAKSAVRLMLLGVKEHDDVVLHVDGEDADAALDQLTAFISDPSAGLAGAPVAAAPAPVAAVPTAPPEGELSESTLRGVAASEGSALGPAFAFFPETLEEAPRAIAATEAPGEMARYRDAVAAVSADLERRRSAPHLTDGDRAILDALLEVMRDTALAEAVEAVVGGGLDAVTATLRAGRELADSFGAAEDAYLRARAEDVVSVTRSLALRLVGRPEPSLEALPQGAVLVADEISAWDLARADLGRVAGIVCLRGAAVSHVSIMARAHGIPAVVGLDVPADRLRAASVVALDGGSGTVRLDPDSATRAAFEAAIGREAEARLALEAWRDAGPMAFEGRTIEVAANLGTLKEIEAAQRVGAHGCGLFRTEFLFMEHKRLPTEDDQAATYRRLAEAMAPHAVVIRTLDVGGDKPVAGIEFPKEDNPFLGWRGVRMCLARPDVFKPQLRALLRAAVVGNVRVMVPMIVDLAEVEAVRALLAECARELEVEGVPHAPVALGIMVETPAAALLAPELAPHVAFFSIGTNDLTQYVMAADRTNPHVAALNRTEHPAVMRAIEMVCRAGMAAGIPVAICGEAAARPDLIATFVRMGVSELSMSPASILRAKKCVAEACLAG